MNSSNQKLFVVSAVLSTLIIPAQSMAAQAVNHFDATLPTSTTSAAAYDLCMAEARSLQEAAKKAELSTLGYVSVGIFGFGNGYAKAYQDAANAAAQKLSECGGILRNAENEPTSDQLDAFNNGSMAAIRDNSRVAEDATNVNKTLPYVDAGIYVAGGTGMAIAGAPFLAAGGLVSAIGGAAAGLGFGTAFGGASAAANLADECVKNPNCKLELNHSTVGMSAAIGTALGPLAALFPTAGAALGAGGSVVAGVDATGDFMNGDYYTGGVNAVAAGLGLAGAGVLGKTASTPPKTRPPTPVTESVKAPTVPVEPTLPRPQAYDSARSMDDILAAIKQTPTHYAESPPKSKFPDLQAFNRAIMEEGGTELGAELQLLRQALIEQKNPATKGPDVSWRVIEPQDFQRLMELGELPSWAKSNGNLETFPLNDPKSLSQLAKDNADGSVGWTPFVNTTDAPYVIAKLYSGRPESNLLITVRNSNEGSLKNPFNYGPGRYGGEQERLWPGAIPGQNISRVYQRVGQEPDGSFIYRLIQIRDPVTGALVPYVPQKPGLGFIRLPSPNSIQ